MLFARIQEVADAQRAVLGFIKRAKVDWVSSPVVVGVVQESMGQFVKIIRAGGDRWVTPQ